MKKTIYLMLVLLMLSACGGPSKKKALDSTLFKYAGMMRWSNYNSAMDFLDPKIKPENVPTDLDIQRLQQFTVSSYQAAPITPGPDETSIMQNVEIKLYNNHTRREKIVVDRQIWRYDEEQKRWWLTTGLPKLVQ
ncbi:hypothetical protein [Marinicella sp. W31]|uniref:hypothetical protein n=1 Tax=Marinicella sp. W31 TaxID=3023713 RepID=UPI003757950C